jgi:small ligand-binding sensory domain FIST
MLAERLARGKRPGGGPAPAYPRAVSRASVALSIQADPARAAAEAAEAALAGLPGRGADAAFVFAAGHGREAARIPAAARERLGTAAVAGAAGHGVLAGSSEEEERPAVAVLALAGIEATPVRLPELAGAEDAAGAELEGALGRSAGEGDLLVLFADPLALDAPRLLRALDEVLAPGSVVGAGAALGPGASLQWCGSEVVSGGACGLVLHLGRPASILLGQGCRPVTAPLVVTRADGHWVLELDGRPALDAYRDAAGGPLAADLRRAAECLLAALPPAGSGAGRASRAAASDGFIARGVAGFSPERRAFALPDEVRVGTALRLALRDGDLARDDLARALASAAAQPGAVLYISCPGRGQRLFRHAGLEAAYVAHALEPAPVGGLFGSFQLGPVAGSTQLLTYAGVLTLIP